MSRFYFSKFLSLSQIIFAIVLISYSPVFSQTFTDSNLPIVIITTDLDVNNQSLEILDDPKILSSMKIIKRPDGSRNYLSDANTTAFLNYNGRIGIEIRGSSSQLLPKKGYGLTTLKADNISNNNVSLMGMPSENDWILNGIAFDPSLIRDYLSYNLSRQLGNYATRTAYCELVINGDYKGLYILQEKIKSSTGRVNILKIATTDNNAPNLTGGYITKADKDTGGDPIAWTMSSYSWGTNFIHELPKPTAVTTQQNSYIYNQFLNLQNTSNTNNINLVTGYPSVIDIPTFIDFMLMNELASNPDGYQFSTFFHKDRSGKLRAGPIWDFNLTYGNDLFSMGFDRSRYNVWQFSDGGNDGPKFWRDLFNNPTYKCYLSKRWK
jgi:spore coat protein CotH